ncbi:MAG: YncE family protein [Frankiales bacterium]|nr:YncE family protein [Frankiales bacterium]
MRRHRFALTLLLVAAAGCTSSHPAVQQSATSAPVASSPAAPSPSAAPSRVPAAGIPALLDPTDIYAAGRPGLLAPEARLARALIYVPDSEDQTVTVIDQKTRSIVQVVHTGRLPQHVTPSYDLKTLYVDNDLGNSLTTINPRTGALGRKIPVTDPYNLYFTADGRFAVVVAEARRRLDFYDAKTFHLVHQLSLPCRGIDHMDFSPDGTHALASCEFGAKMVYVDMQHQRLEKELPLPAASAPQDVKISPDGKTYYVADMQHGGVYLIDAATISVIRFLPTGRGAHGLYPSRDSKTLYITNRTGQSISLLSFATRSLVGRWTIPGGTPDMGGLDASGRVLWLSGRYSSEVYAIDTSNGHLLARIPVGRGPHGLCVWPQPGRYSLGHTGILR